ncbi:unnamed protein product, partial [Mycena citricolor]
GVPIDVYPVPCSTSVIRFPPTCLNQIGVMNLSSMFRSSYHQISIHDEKRKAKSPVLTPCVCLTISTEIRLDLQCDRDGNGIG